MKLHLELSLELSICVEWFLNFIKIFLGIKKFYKRYKIFSVSTYFRDFINKPRYSG